MEYNSDNQVYDYKNATIYDRVIRINGHGNWLKNAHLVRCKVEVVGVNNTVTDLKFHEAPKEDGPIVWLYGGYKYAMEQSFNSIAHCEFWCRSKSQGTIELVGCGASAHYNWLHNQSNPFPAIKMIGAMHSVKYNEIECIYDPSKSDDAGMIVCGRRLDWPMGSVRNNKINMVQLLTDNQLDTLKMTGLYCDDMMSCMDWELNEVSNFPIGAKLGGGSFNTFKNNTYSRCGRGIAMDARGIEWMVGTKAAETLKSLADIPRDSELWKRFGDLLGKWTPAPTGNIVRKNYYIGCRKNTSLDHPELYGVNDIQMEASHD